MGTLSQGVCVRDFPLPEEMELGKTSTDNDLGESDHRCRVGGWRGLS